MKFSHRQLFWLVVLVFECAVASVALADDTEVYVGLAADQAVAKPNVLLVIDTSGSMDTLVTTADYNPLVDYPGDCDSNSIYWWRDQQTTHPKPPPCSHNQRWFNKDRLVCQAAKTPLATIGQYLGRIAQWRGRPRDPDAKRWRAVSGADWAKSNTDNYVECEADQGNHGNNLLSGNKWIKNGNNGPWIRDETKATSWGNVGALTNLYTGNYLNWWHDADKPTVQKSRLEVVKTVAENLVNSVSGVNMGLMQFDKTGGYNKSDHYSYNNGGSVQFPIRDIDVSLNRSDLYSTIAALSNPNNATPLAETYWEAKLYYRGEAPLFGDDSSPANVFSAKLHDGSGTYQSPIINACTKNYIVYLTDGEPQYDNQADTEINSALSKVAGLTDSSCGFGTGQLPGRYGDDCFDELAEYLYKTDSSSDLIGTQNIVTYTIGFNIKNDLLTGAATKGGGQFYLASNTIDLSAAFNDIITRILSVNTTFTSPAVTVNAFNRLVNNNDVYFTVFRPSDRKHWDGNIKKYKLDLVKDANGETVDDDNDGLPDINIFDANHKPAVDSLTGFFADKSTSYWTLAADAPDGEDARIGGLADRLYNFENGNHVADTRKVYTYTGTTNTLSDSTNKVTESNAQTSTNTQGKLTKTMFDVTDQTDTQFADLVKWASGVDLSDDDEDSSTDDGRPIMGAPLHSKPVIVTYGIRGTGADAYQDATLFVSTNDGYFHAATVRDPGDSPKTGDQPKLEEFAYIPPDQLPKLKELKSNLESNDIQYGLDGPLEVWVDDRDHDGRIENSNGTLQQDNHVYVYFGERRGGRVYHALDVTDRANPKLLWTINGKEAGPNDPFSQLGQTWSKSVHRRMKINGTTKDVLIFGGGYDTGHDSADEARDSNGDSQGNAIYIVDAKTGALLWWASDSAVGTKDPDLRIAGLKYSIPAGVRAVDTNADGLVDTLFVGDTGGQILRFDVTDNGITGGVIADLQLADAGDSPTAANNRMFYETPDVTMVEPTGEEPYLTVAIGSGYRAHPLDKTVQDRAYVLRVPVAAPTSYTTLHEDDLLDVTDIISKQDFADLTDDQNSKLAKGWYIKLEDSGEKVLAEALTLGGRMMFTTFVPPNQSISIDQQSCAPNQGVGRLYMVNFLTGQPVANLNHTGGSTYTIADRFETLTKPGIAPDPVAVVPNLGDGSRGVILVGPQVINGNGRTFDRTYWYQNQAHE